MPGSNPARRSIMDVNIKDVIGGTAYFSHYQNGNLYYSVTKDNKRYVFPIDITNTDDVGNAVFESQYKGITLMRYIRKAISDETMRVVTLPFSFKDDAA
jgi:hypothetical protein